LANDRQMDEQPSRSSYGDQDDRRRRTRRPMRSQRRKVCMFCGSKAPKIDYKAVNQLQSFVTDRGKILPRRATGMCAKHQRALAVAVKRARHLALLPYTVERYRG